MMAGSSSSSSSSSTLSSSSTNTTTTPPPGRLLPGVFALHPYTKRKLPIYIADYVIDDYGSGAVMGVPAHDERDEAFSRAMNIPSLPPVIDNSTTTSARMIRSEIFDGQPIETGRKMISALAMSQGWGGEDVRFRLRDWLVSRQRYWGAPIPLIHCARCGVVPVPEKDLPVELPVEPKPLAQNEDWLRVTCPSCGGAAKRDSDTMDTFVDSSWYFLRYPDARNHAAAFDPAKVAPWIPVHQYVGGVEHAILHLLYSRFITRFLHSQGLVPSPEPFQKLLAQGMVLGKTFKDSRGNILKPSRVRELSDGTAELAQTDVGGDGGGDGGEEQGGKANGNSSSSSNNKNSKDDKVSICFEKMSKSKYNGVDPDSVVDQYGADTVRVYMLFKAPPEGALEWDERGIVGVTRWFGRLHDLAKVCAAAAKAVDDDPADERDRKALSTAHLAISFVTNVFESTHSFNVAVAELMKFSNTLSELYLEGAETKRGVGVATIGKNEQGNALQAAFRILCVMLRPMAPTTAEELWSIATAGGGHLLQEMRWPTSDPKLILARTTMIRAILVNGKVRGEIEVPVDASPEEIEKQALESEIVRIWVLEKNLRIVRKIVPPGANVVNLVAAPAERGLSRTQKF